MRELSLFSGIGCGVLGTKTLGWRTIGYVEFNEYCQQVLAQRIKDGILDRAPIFGDINSFIESGCADQYRGSVDVLSAGFPCQPFSVAGRERAERDDRNQWTTTLDTIRRTQPRYCLLENVPGLLSRKHRYFEKILKDLSESGYDAKWKVIPASELGAPHKRDRLWIRATLSNPNSQRGCLRETHRQDAKDAGESPRSSGFGWWSSEPSVGRVVDGCSNRVQRLKALGNGQVPIVAKTAWEILA